MTAANSRKICSSPSVQTNASISKSRKLKVYYVSTMIKGECSILLKGQHTECLIGHDTKIQIFQSKC